MSVELRQLKAHEKLIKDVICRQSGTLEKAIMELCMNAIEAGATQVDMNLKVVDNKAVFLCSDNGRGIQTLEEVDQHFATFGTPHSSSENKIWAQFRMGRGQAWSFGKNTWRTSNFELVVDIENLGLNYQVRHNLPLVNGCDIIIELYRNPFPSNYASINALIDGIKRQVAFMPVPIYFNGEQLSRQPQSLNWDYEDANAYYLFGAGVGLSVYNLGAFVHEFEASRFGVVGIVVSKKQLKVNFARNDIQSDCGVWFEISQIVRANRVKKTREASRRLDSDERIATLREIRDRQQDWREVRTLGLIETTSGRVVSLDYILKNRQPWTFAPANNVIADRLMQRDTSLCFATGICSLFNYTKDLKNFFYWLTGAQEFSNIATLYCDFESLSSSFSESYTILPYEKLTRVERRIIRLVERYGILKNRKLCWGISDVAAAWTDGWSYVALSRDYWQKRSFSSSGDIAEFFATLMHEMSHDIQTDCSHIHGLDFYRTYHELTCCDGSPMRFISHFAGDIRSAIKEEYSQQVIKRQTKANLRAEKKLTGRLPAARACKVDGSNRTSKNNDAALLEW